MPLTVQIDDSAVGTILRSLVREAENRDIEAHNLSKLVQDFAEENAKLRDALRADNNLDWAHDRMEELAVDNRRLTNLVSEMTVELDYFQDRVQSLAIENEALIDWNEEAADRLLDLNEQLGITEHELDRVASLAGERFTPEAYSIPANAFGVESDDFDDFDYDDVDAGHDAAILKSLTT